jgi:hypothetical protein
VSARISSKLPKQRGEASDRSARVPNTALREAKMKVRLGGSTLKEFLSFEIPTTTMAKTGVF